MRSTPTRARPMDSRSVLVGEAVGVTPKNSGELPAATAVPGPARASTPSAARVAATAVIPLRVLLDLRIRSGIGTFCPGHEPACRPRDAFVLLGFAYGCPPVKPTNALRDGFA